MKQNISYTLQFLLFSILACLTSLAQDSLILEEIQTLNYDGTLNMIEEYRINELGKITRFSRYNTEENSIFINDVDYDSLNRPIKEKSYYNNNVTDSVIYQYSNYGQKTEIRYSPDYSASWKSRKWLIKYNEKDLPINEYWYEITVFMNGDTSISLLSESRKFYDENQRLILDSTFIKNSGQTPLSRVVDGKIVHIEKLNSAIVKKYVYHNQFLISTEHVDEYGNKLIDNITRKENGDYLRYEQIFITMNDTTSIVSNYSYEKMKGQKVQTVEMKFGSGYSKTRTFFDKKGREIAFENFDVDGNIFFMISYYYNEEGYLKMERGDYFSSRKQINTLTGDSKGYTKKYFYTRVPKK